MSIRYERQGLRVVRVVDATRPVFEPPEAPLSLEDAAASLHRTAAGLRADAQRKQRWGFSGAPKQQPNPQRTLPGADLRRARLAAGLTQRALALESGLARGLIAEIELGHRSCPLGLAEWARSQLAIYGPASGAESQAEARPE